MREFLEFVRTCYLVEMANAPAAVSAVARAECVPVRETRTPVVNQVEELTGTTVPYRLDTPVFVDIEVDYKDLIAGLKSKTDLARIPVRDTTIVYGTTVDRLDTWQLPPLSSALLRLCDGRHTVAEIVRLFQPPSGTELDGIPAEKVCLFGLMQLKEDGLIGLSAIAADVGRATRPGAGAHGGAALFIASADDAHATALAAFPVVGSVRL